MSKIISRVGIEQTVVVTIDPSKFDEKFMADFRESFYPFDTVEEHISHLGQMYARGLISNGSFIEGYGPAEDMGISFRCEDGGFDVHIWNTERVE